MVTPQKAITMNTKSNTSSAMTSNDTHTLKNKWNLWGHLPQDNDWSVGSYKLVSKLKTLEDVIAISETTPDPLIKSCMLFVMKDGIVPMWEDQKNRNGGCFSYKVSNKNVCEVWRELNYVLVGESISNNSSFVNCVTGITISPKKNFCIIKIWMCNCDNQNPTLVTSDVVGLTSQGCIFKKHTPEF
jgi:Translation initiation factor 4E (eIF-4E)